MTIKVGINGFGRIGRLTLRAALEKGGIEVVGINDLFPASALAQMFKYDSIHGVYKGEVKATENALVIDGKEIPVTAVKDPAELPWKEKQAYIVVESTGLFTTSEKAEAHIKAGAKKVLISAPAKGDVCTIVLGVNEGIYDAKKHNIISNASCTTNCLAPFVKVIHDKWTVLRGLMTTIHAYTNDQVIQDQPHKKDPRRARAAALSMIPTSTGAAAAIGLVIPELKGKLDGFAIRVPTPNVSVVDLTCELAKPTTAKEINDAIKAAANGPLKGILALCEEPLVSVDFNHSSLSSTVDAELTKVMDGTFVKMCAWYDNEWGYSNRVIDLIKYIASKE